MTYKLYSAIIACALWAAPVAAQTQCGGTADFYGLLAKEYDEAMLWAGSLDNGNVVTLWINTETETWTIAVTSGDVSCLVASGTGFASIPTGGAL